LLKKQFKHHDHFTVSQPPEYHHSDKNDLEDQTPLLIVSRQHIDKKTLSTHLSCVFSLPPRYDLLKVHDFSSR
jgi:hypothetical protein